MSETLTTDDLDRLELYIKTERIKVQKGKALVKKDFVEWARLSAVWLLDRIEYAWRWVRRQLGMDV